MKMLRYDEVFGNGHPVMIKLGNKLRLSARELGAFRKMTGVYPAPATVDEHNGALERAASAWKDKDGSPASQLLQAVLLAERIPKE
jgi:2-hydroxychromene-2-carboxylate isomerase